LSGVMCTFNAVCIFYIKAILMLPLVLEHLYLTSRFW